MSAKKSRKASKEVSVVSKTYNDYYGYKDFKLTPNQKRFEEVINSNTLVFCEGPAGTGKTASALYTFIKEYLKDKNKNIVVIRTPAESTDQDKVGFLPDSLESKIEPHFASVRIILEELLNKGKVDCDLGSRIKFMIPNYALGMTIKDSLVVCDECQLMSPLVMKLLLERIGEGTKMVVLGDSSQVYSSNKARGGLQDAIEKFFYTGTASGNYEPKFDDVAYFAFGSDDVMRSAMAKKVVMAYRGEVETTERNLRAQKERLKALENTYE